MSSARILFLALLVLQAGLLPSHAQEPAPTPPPVPSIAPERIIVEGDSALHALEEIQNAFSSANPLEDLDAGLKEHIANSKNFYEESRKLLAAQPGFDQLRRIEEGAAANAITLGAWRYSLDQYSKELFTWQEQIDQMVTLWTATKQSLVDPAPELSQRVQSVLAQAQSLRSKIQARQKKLISLDGRLTDEAGRLRDIQNSIKKSSRRAMGHLLERDRPPVWSSEFRGNIDRSFSESQDSWSAQSESLKTYIVWHSGKIFLQAVLTIALIFILFIIRRRMRNWSKDDAELKSATLIFETPIAVAFLLSLNLSGLLYPFSPILWKSFLGAILLIPTMVILTRLVEKRLYPVLNALVLFYFLDQLRLLFSPQPGMLRIIFLAELIGAIVFLIWTLKSFQRDSASGSDPILHAVKFGGRIALFLLSIALVADSAGYTRLSTLMLNGVLRSSYVAVIFYAGAHVLQALIMACFKVPFLAKLGIVRQYRALLLRRTFRLLNWMIFFLWLAIMLETFSLRVPVFEKIGAVLSDPIHLGSISFSLSDLIAFGLTIWASFLLSRLVRFVLENDVYPRLHLAYGVPYAVSTVLHYAILTLAFFMATASLGIDMTKFTILVSAFGVGVGFGLQNIINNFVSGLILLFERPIKIGDSIQIGDAVGTVRRIGIRASVLRTSNGSEIIVPNGTLISTNVTNWTLSKQRRIVVIPVNVVRGPDPEKVIALMKSEAARHEAVVKEPHPTVMVTAVGANLSFELRVWTDEVSRWNEIRSELLLAIESALAKEEIKVA